MRVRQHARSLSLPTKEPDPYYRATRKSRGGKFRLRCFQSDEIGITLKEGAFEVGNVSAQVCYGSAGDMASDADAIDNHGPEVMMAILQTFPKLRTFADQLTFIYIGNLEVNETGRKLGWLLLHEVVKAARRMHLSNPLFCWYSCPLAGEKSVSDADRLIRYYRGVGAINPFPEKRIMLWDPLHSLSACDILIQDEGPRPAIASLTASR